MAMATPPELERTRFRGLSADLDRQDPEMRAISG
jgi:hypothetical protein